jgi:hypothetical protein
VAAQSEKRTEKRKNDMCGVEGLGVANRRQKEVGQKRQKGADKKRNFPPQPTRIADIFYGYYEDNAVEREQIETEGDSREVIERVVE